MQLIDMHCDTFYRMKECTSRQNIIKNQLHVDLEKLKSAHSLIQCFALYSDIEACEKKGRDPWTYMLELYSLIRDEIEGASTLIEVVTSVDQAQSVHNKGKLAAMLTVEDGGIIYQDMNRLDMLYKMGVRMLSLTWDYSNSLGHPNLPQTTHLGLTGFGRSVVERMNELGMIIDVSHLSDKGFWEVIDITRQPIVASHSNARSVMAHRRNLSDAMLGALGENGGVAGLNFCPYFVADKNKHLYINDLVEHVRHIVNYGGADCAAIGTDFDGMNGILEIEHIGEMEKLYTALRQSGFSTAEADKVFYKNAKRVFEDVIG